MLAAAGDFTVLIKNSITYPKFNFHRSVCAHAGDAHHARARTCYLPVSPQEEHPPAHRVLLPEELPVQRGDRPRMPHLPAEVHGVRGRGGLPGHGREGPDRTSFSGGLTSQLEQTVQTVDCSLRVVCWGYSLTGAVTWTGQEGTNVTPNTASGGWTTRTPTTTWPPA